jgi:outer membrane lipoprotein SlyB
MKAVLFAVIAALALCACSTFTSPVYDSGPARQVTNSLQYGAIPVTNGAGDRIPVMSGQAR